MPSDQHGDAEQHQRHAEIARRAARASATACFAQLLEELEDRESEADQRQRRCGSPTSACGPRSCACAGTTCRCVARTARSRSGPHRPAWNCPRAGISRILPSRGTDRSCRLLDPIDDPRRRLSRIPRCPAFPRRLCARRTPKRPSIPNDAGLAPLPASVILLRWNAGNYAFHRLLGYR